MRTTEEQLAEIEWLVSPDGGCDSFTFEKQHIPELLRVCRLGLWAQNVAKPALDFASTDTHFASSGKVEPTVTANAAREALSSYPKETP